MKNILNETPQKRLTGRLLASTMFCSQSDINKKNVLNIGCGFGWFEIFAATLGVKKIAGIEISDDDLKTAKKNIRLSNVEFKKGNAIKIPFKNKSFNTVVSWEVIEHIPKNTEQEMFKEVFRVLKPGGKFYLSTPYSNIFSRFLDPAWWLIAHRHYSANNLLELANNNGFSIERMSIKGGWWTTIGILNMYFSKWILRRKMLFEKMFMNKTTEEYINGNQGFNNIFVLFKKNES